MSEFPLQKQLAELKAALDADPANVESAERYWAALATFGGNDVQSSGYLIEAFRGCALASTEGTVAFARAYQGFGYAFMFGHGNGFIGWGDADGHAWWFLQNGPHTYEGTGVAFLAHWLFQFAFADTCSTITSGAMIGRTGFVGDLLYSVCVSGFIYPIIGHWAWGPDGWLATRCEDYASRGSLLTIKSAADRGSSLSKWMRSAGK